MKKIVLEYTPYEARRLPPPSSFIAVALTAYGLSSIESSSPTVLNLSCSTLTSSVLSTPLRFGERALVSGSRSASCDSSQAMFDMMTTDFWPYLLCGCRVARLASEDVAPAPVCPA
ncbi:hypothetical protein HYQ46_005519 [Verticillium longisporum]|nr:hypothetical protein HYQ46_005519 [Verticillium longisporum]